MAKMQDYNNYLSDLQHERFNNALEIEANLTISQELYARWTTKKGSKYSVSGYWAAKVEVVKINKRSVIVRLISRSNMIDGVCFISGQKVKIPLAMAKGWNMDNTLSVEEDVKNGL